MRTRATSRNLFGFLTKKTVTYQRSRGQASPSIRAYRAGVQSGDTGGFDSWLEKQPGVRDAGRSVRDRLEKQYRRGVERAGVADRVSTARKGKKAAGGSASRGSSYKGVRIIPSADGFKLSKIDRESTFDTVQDAKDFIRDSKQNPGCAVTRRSHVTDRAKRYRANQPGCKPGGVKKCKLCARARDLMVDHIDGNESNGRKANLRWLCRSCNTLRGAEMARTGQGRRTVQYNPGGGGAKTLGEYIEAILQHRRGAHDAGGKIIHETPKSRRREFASQIWAARQGRAGAAYESNPGGYESIRAGARVTIVDRFGKQHTGRAIMRGPAGWVLNMGGRHGTPAIASPENVVKVTGGGTYKELLEAGSYGNPDGRITVRLQPGERQIIINNRWTVTVPAGLRDNTAAFDRWLDKVAKQQGLTRNDPLEFEFIERNPQDEYPDGATFEEFAPPGPAYSVALFDGVGKMGENVPIVAATMLDAQQKAQAYADETGRDAVLYDVAGLSIGRFTTAAVGQLENPAPAGSSTHFQAGYRWLVAKRRSSKGSFLTTPGADQYLKKMGLEGTLSIRPPYGNDSVRQRVELARTMRQEFLDGAEAAWNDALARQHPGDDMPNPKADEWITVEPVHGYDFETQEDYTIPTGTIVVPTGNASDKSVEFRLPWGRLIDVRFAIAKHGIRRPKKGNPYNIPTTTAQFDEGITYGTELGRKDALAGKRKKSARSLGIGTQGHIGPKSLKAYKEAYSRSYDATRAMMAAPAGGQINPASIYDYEDATRAGRERASELIRQTGISSKSARTIQKATLVRDFGAWWTHAGGSEYAQPADKSGNLAAFLRGFKGLRNPEQTDPGNADADYEQALRIAELFHGRAVKEEITVTEMIREHDWLWRIGPLVELRIKALTGGTFDIPFSESEETTVHLFCSPDGKQFYLRGGDQEVDLDALKMGPRTEWFKDLMLIGEAKEITYQDQKKFHRFKLIDYYHKLGEVTRKKPMLSYNSLAKRLEILGGQYRVETKELVDGMSPGIVN